MPRYTSGQGQDRVKSAGIFVQCDPEGEGTSWSCQAHAKITLRNYKTDDFTMSKILYLIIYFFQFFMLSSSYFCAVSTLFVNSSTALRQKNCLVNEEE